MAIYEYLERHLGPLWWAPFGEFFYDFSADAGAERLACECPHCRHPFRWRLPDHPWCVVCEECGSVEDDLA